MAHEELTGFYYFTLLGRGPEICHVFAQTYIPNQRCYILSFQTIDGSIHHLGVHDVAITERKLGDNEGQLEWALAKMKS
jgi:hypothetical protein